MSMFCEVCHTRLGKHICAKCNKMVCDVCSITTAVGDDIRTLCHECNFKEKNDK